MSFDVADYFDLKEPIVTDVHVELPAKARALYDDMEKDMYVEIEGSPIEAFGAAARTMKCLQLANGAAYLEGGTDKWAEVHDVKLQALESIVEEAAGAPVLVSYNFKSDLERLKQAFPKGRVLDKNPQTIRDWNAGKIRVLFAHPASAGHGLNLQDGGNIIVFFGHNWNLEEYMQIIERIGPVRQMQAGHNRPVYIYHIIARHTVDELVMQRRVSKREVQDILMEAMKYRERKIQ
jgi:SNF2 family DNA or RNA helicase